MKIFGEALILLTTEPASDACASRSARRCLRCGRSTLTHLSSEYPDA
jgi:hypothetical protein